MGKTRFENSSRILITADGGGSNSIRSRLWKKELQLLAEETGMEIRVCHFPAGTSKWNKIEHRLFSYISLNWSRLRRENQSSVNSRFNQCHYNRKRFKSCRWWTPKNQSYKKWFPWRMELYHKTKYCTSYFVTLTKLHEKLKANHNWLTVYHSSLIYPSLFTAFS